MKWAFVEAALSDAEFFCGEHFTLVDCAFAPALRYFDVLEKLGDWTFIPPGSKLADYRKRLMAHPSVKNAVAEDYLETMIAYIGAKESWMAGKAKAYLAA